MDCKPGEAALERHRSVLRSLSRRELQARAKALGVRANGKSVEIIETVAKVLSRPSSPVKYLDSDSEVDDDRENDSRRGGASFQERPVAVRATTSPMDCPEEGDQRQPSRPAAPDTTVLPAGHGPAAAAGLQASPTPSPMTGAGHTPRGSAAAATVSTPRSSVLTGSLAELAALASAATLAVSLQNLRFETQLKASARGTTPASLRRDTCLPLSMGSDRERDSSPNSSPLQQHMMVGQQVRVSGTEEAELADPPAFTAVTQPALDAEEEEPARRLTFAFSPPPLGGGHAPFRASPASCRYSALSPAVEHQPRDRSSTPALKPFAGSKASGSGAGRNCKGASSPAEAATTAAPSSLPVDFAAPLGPAVGAGAAMPAFVRPAGESRPVVNFVTDRTPMRQQRLLGTTLQPLGAATAAATPAGARGAAVPRTPGTGLRTPARRVPIITDESKERAMDEWVAQNLLKPAGSPIVTAGLSWRELVGLRDVKQHLQAMCVSNDVPSPSVSASTRGGVTNGKGCRASAGVAAADGQARAARPPAGIKLPNAAVLVCGPSGTGKSHLARALTSELGAAYVHVPFDVHRRVVREPGGTDIVMRAVVRVAAQLPGPVVVHLEDVDQLAGVEVVRQGQDRRRLRTELLVAVDELLLQQTSGPTAASPGHNGLPFSARGASPASSTPGGGASAAAEAHGTSGGGGCRSQFKVLVLSTTSRPMDLDAALTASLGRTGRLLAAPPCAEDREMYLFGRLASEGAALGVEHLERIVRQTENFSCAQLAALCDGAVKAAAARQASLGEEDIGVALRQLEPRSGAEMAELEQWYLRVQAAPLRRVA